MSRQTSVSGPGFEDEDDLAAAVKEGSTRRVAVASNSRMGGDSARYGLHILVVAADEDDYSRQAAKDLDGHLTNCDVRVANGLEGAAKALATQCDDEVECLVPGVIITPRLGKVDEVVGRLKQNPILNKSGFVLLTDQKRHDDVAESVGDGSLVSVVAVPWTQPAIVDQITAVIDRWLFNNLPDAEITRSVIGGDPYDEPRAGDLLYGLDTPGETVQRVLLEGIERILGPRPRMILPEGVNLTRQGESVDAVYLVLRGSVALHRSSQFGDVLLHHATSGPLIGLVSLARQQRALFTSTTTTEVELIRLSLEQLELVLQQSPDTSANLAVVAIQALTQRLVRAEYLHIEQNELAEQLEIERGNLQAALEELRSTREQLVDQTKFAMLGELSAGIAHELNNPVAALQRSTQHIAQDLEAVLGSSSDLDDALQAMERTLHARPRSTSEDRALVRQVMEHTGGDRALAKRLVAAEITHPDQIKALLKKERFFGRLRGKTTPIQIIEAAAHIGRSVKNSTVASNRITDLVSSLKAYARPDTSPIEGVDLHENIEDVLRLTSHRTRGVTVEREYGKLPPIRCYPARLEQVWTNLVVNASEALEDEVEALTQAEAYATSDNPDTGQVPKFQPARGTDDPTITISTAQIDESHVRVTITDNGPGIPDAIVEKIMEPHFTTKGGQVRFGLGMGMSISNSIVEDHGGTLTIDSEPGRTSISIVLPIEGPAGEPSSNTVIEDSED
ncbi:MAG: ATP-binding protein [Actinomycetaceae bacterium]|nr:ATP-binding protein [Actinomycetaceae bacterium]